MAYTPDYLRSTIEEINQKIEETKKLLNDPEMSQIANEEIQKLEAEKADLLRTTSYELRATSQSDNPEANYDNRNIILEIRGAAGGEEAKLWGEDLLRMYTRYAQSQGWAVSPEGALAIKIKGRGVYGKLKFESGVHRVQRIPVTESSGRVHTSTATVAVLPELEDFDIHIDPKDIQEDFYRSGGHGGQNVNKVSSAVRLTHLPTGIVVTCQDERDQPKNRAKALEKLRQILWEQEQDRQLRAMSDERRAQIGTGMRNEKIRTYNFMQDRVTDHRLEQNFHNINVIMEGKLDDLISSLQKKYSSV